MGCPRCWEGVDAVRRRKNESIMVVLLPLCRCGHGQNCRSVEKISVLACTKTRGLPLISPRGLPTAQALSIATIYFQIQKSVALDQYTALKVRLQARELSLLTNQAPMLVV